MWRAQRLLLRPSRPSAPATGGDSAAMLSRCIAARASPCSTGLAMRACSLPLLWPSRSLHLSVASLAPRRAGPSTATTATANPAKPAAKPRPAPPSWMKYTLVLCGGLLVLVGGFIASQHWAAHQLRAESEWVDEIAKAQAMHRDEEGELSSGGVTQADLPSAPVNAAERQKLLYALWESLPAHVLHQSETREQMNAPPGALVNAALDLPGRVEFEAVMSSMQQLPTPTDPRALPASNSSPPAAAQLSAEECALAARRLHGLSFRARAVHAQASLLLDYPARWPVSDDVRMHLAHDLLLEGTQWALQALAYERQLAALKQQNPTQTPSLSLSDKDVAVAWSTLTDSYARLGRRDETERSCAEWLRRGVAVKPSPSVVASRLAQLHAARGEWDAYVQQERAHVLALLDSNVRGVEGVSFSRLSDASMQRHPPAVADALLHAQHAVAWLAAPMDLRGELETKVAQTRAALSTDAQAAAGARIGNVAYADLLSDTSLRRRRAALRAPPPGWLTQFDHWLLFPLQHAAIQRREAEEQWAVVAAYHQLARAYEAAGNTEQAVRAGAFATEQAKYLRELARAAVS